MSNLKDKTEGKVRDLGFRLSDMCKNLDSERLKIIDILPTWVDTSNASSLIQAMAHLDSAIRILEETNTNLTSAIAALENWKKQQGTTRKC